MLQTRNTTGGRKGDRTLDLRVANAALSQLSYSPPPDILKIILRLAASGKRDFVAGEILSPVYRPKQLYFLGNLDELQNAWLSKTKENLNRCLPDRKE
jgi:hypothetical protein